MVFIYELNNQNSTYKILAPQSPQENSQMIQYGFPSDVWFHIENSKYLPVYLRQEFTTIPTSALKLEDIPPFVISQCSDIVKHLANTKRDVNINYTFVSNMSLNGPVKPSMVESEYSKTKRSGPIASPQLVATQKQQTLDFELERSLYDKKLRSQTSENFRKAQKEQLENSKVYQAIAEQKNRGYSDLFADEEILQSSSNQNRSEDWEDDFM